MYSDKIKEAIEKYESGVYDERGFSNTLENTTNLITESHLEEVKSKLISFVGDLETIYWMTDKENHKKEYQEVIFNLQKYLNSTN
jgi:hypothetical protein